MVKKPKSLVIVLFLILIYISLINDRMNAQAATIQISNQAFTLTMNHYKTLYISGSSKAISWSSSNKSIAAVSSTGRVTAKAPGTAMIYATVAGKKLTCKVNVIKLSASSYALAVGSAKTIQVFGTNASIAWSSSNQTIATVSNSGKITAKSPGTVTIYASVASKKLECNVSVIKLNSSAVSLTTDESKTLKVLGTANAVQWTSSNSSVAVVSSSGVITPKAAGTASITADILGIKLSADLTVNPPVEEAIILMDSSSTEASNQYQSSGITEKVIGYYAAWSRYSGFTPSKLDANKLTHINYAFANIGSDLKIQLGYPDIDPKNILAFNQLKQLNPNLKTLISVGGWSWSGRFSDVALTDASRTVFADSCVDFIVKYGFDGVDIDWEYPVAGGFTTNVRRAEDKYNFTLLLKALRDKLDARGVVDGKKYLLTFAGAAGSWYLKNIEPGLISQYVDYANIMTYDLHGTWDASTDFNAPLYSSDPLHPNYTSVDKSIRDWVNTGFPKDKIVMGVPFYGYIYKSVTNQNNGYHQTYSGGASISYANVAANYLNNPEYISYYHNDARAPWLYNGSTFITYENEQSMAEKAQYIKNNGLGGVMIWELSQDPNKILLNSLYQVLSQY